MLTVSIVAPIYAGTLAPSLRATCITLTGVINGVATILLFIFIDPHLSTMTDDVVKGKCSEARFRGCIVGMVVTRIIGAFASMLILVPAAQAIVFVAKMI